MTNRFDSGAPVIIITKWRIPFFFQNAWLNPVLIVLGDVSRCITWDDSGPDGTPKRFRPFLPFGLKKPGGKPQVPQQARRRRIHANDTFHLPAGATPRPSAKSAVVVFGFKLSRFPVGNGQKQRLLRQRQRLRSRPHAQAPTTKKRRRLRALSALPRFHLPGVHGRGERPSKALLVDISDRRRPCGVGSRRVARLALTDWIHSFGGTGFMGTMRNFSAPRWPGLTSPPSLPSPPTS